MFFPSVVAQSKIKSVRLYWATLVGLFFITGAVNLQVPLYPMYAQINGTGHTLSALAFSAYVVGLLPVLMFLSGISDRLGCRVALLLALLCSLLATLIMTVAPSISSLFVARLLQGVGVGIGMSTATAWLIQQNLKPEKTVSIHVAVVSSTGFGGGALLTTLSLMTSALNPPISFSLFILGIIVTLLFLAFAAQAKPQKTQPLSRFPIFYSKCALVYFGIFIAWSVSGLVIAVLPAQLAIHHLSDWAGLVLFLVNIVGVFVQPIAKNQHVKFNCLFGAILIPSGYLLMLFGTNTGQIFPLLLGASIAGAAAYGFTYLGGLSHVIETASPADKARAVSGYFLFAYAGFSIPVVLTAVLADQTGLTQSLELFAYAIVTFNLLSVFVTLNSFKKPFI